MAETCSFCRRSSGEAGKLIAGSDARICGGCLKRGSAVYAEKIEGRSAPAVAETPPNPHLPSPREIKAYLDASVVGQERAKVDLSIAVYNHYLRRRAAGGEIQKSNILLLGPSGCHRKGQLVLMYSGELKVVEEIKVGDKLMGPDSKPRTVLSLCRGREKMVQISPTKGTPWVVNASHVLTVVRTSRSLGKTASRPKIYRAVSEVKDVLVRDYIGWSRTQKSIHKMFRVGVEFSATKTELPIEPYFMGILLGDGCLRNRQSVSKPDREIIDEVYRQAEQWKLRVSKEGSGTSASYHLTTGRIGGKPNALRETLRALGIFNSLSESKFIPVEYKTASREDRLALLAGLLDTDGYMANGCFDFISKSRVLSDDVAFVARSLGFAAYVKRCRKGCQTGKVGTYFRVSLSGHLIQVPTRILRKKAAPRKQVKDVLRVGFTTKILSVERYFGFTLSGDGRYLLGDFTVTHNSGKTELARTIATLLNVPFYVGDATRLTAAGYVGDDVESLIQGLLVAAGGDLGKASWGIVFVDEFDKLARKSGRSGTGIRDVGGEGVQQSILKMLEGSVMNIPRGMGARAGVPGVECDPIDTRDVLFICAGSFAGIEEIVGRRLNASAHVGFGSSERRKLSCGESYLAVTEDDILEFGLIPEVLGRLPVITSCVELSEGELVRILTEPRNAIVKQFVSLFALDGISLEFSDAALRAIAVEAKRRPTGARALRSIVEGVLRQHSFEREPGRRVTVTAEDVTGAVPLVAVG